MMLVLGLIFVCSGICRWCNWVFCGEVIFCGLVLVLVNGNFMLDWLFSNYMLLIRMFFRVMVWLFLMMRWCGLFVGSVVSCIC